MNFIWHYWLEIFFGLIVTLVGYLYRRVGYYVKQIDRNEEALKELLKNTIVEKYTEYEKKGKITLAEKDSLFELYHKYKSIGCDAFIKDIMNKVRELPNQDS